MPVAVIDAGVETMEHPAPGLGPAVTTNDPTPEVSPENQTPISSGVVRISTDGLDPSRYPDIPRVIELRPASLHPQLVRQLSSTPSSSIDRIIQIWRCSQRPEWAYPPPPKQGQVVAPSVQQPSQGPVQHVPHQPHQGPPVQHISTQPQQDNDMNSPYGPTVVTGVGTPPLPPVVPTAQPVGPPVRPLVKVIFDLPAGAVSGFFHEVTVTPALIILTFDTTQQTSQFVPKEVPQPIYVTIPHIGQGFTCLVRQDLQWSVPGFNLNQIVLIRSDEQQPGQQPSA